MFRCCAVHGTGWALRALQHMAGVDGSAGSATLVEGAIQPAVALLSQSNEDLQEQAALLLVTQPLHIWPHLPSKAA